MHEAIYTVVDATGKKYTVRGSTTLTVEAVLALAKQRYKQVMRDVISMEGDKGGTTIETDRGGGPRATPVAELVRQKQAAHRVVSRR